MKEVSKNNVIYLFTKTKQLIKGIVYDCTNDRILVLVEKKSIQNAKTLNELDNVAVQINSEYGKKLMYSTVISGLNQHNCLIIENTNEISHNNDRQSVRATVNFNFDVNYLGDLTQCSSIDLSIGGMAFKTSKTFTVGEIVDIILPKELFSTDISIKAKVIKNYNNITCVKFDKINLYDEDKISKFVFKIICKNKVE